MDIKDKKKQKWTILEYYKLGEATIVYLIGINGDNDYIQIQMVNWPYSDRCRICNILDSTGKSIFYQ